MSDNNIIEMHTHLSRYFTITLSAIILSVITVSGFNCKIPSFFQVNNNIQQWLFECKECNFCFCSTECKESQEHLEICNHFSQLPRQIQTEEIVEVTIGLGAIRLGQVSLGEVRTGEVR